MVSNLSTIWILFMIWGCTSSDVEPAGEAGTRINTASTSLDCWGRIKKKSELERLIINSGLIDIESLDSSILVNLVYSTTGNFLGIDLYGDLEKAYLQPDVAEKLHNAQEYLAEIKPGYKIVVLDAVRPKSVQQKMWDTINLPIAEKVKFVSNPRNGSLHNYGAAVDVTLADGRDSILDMGTPFDYIGELAHPVEEKRFLLSGELSMEQVENRKLLRQVMWKAGFFNIQTEWWHFNACRREEAKEKYVLIE